MPNYNYVFRSIVDHDYDEFDDADLFPDESDTDTTGLETSLDQMDDSDPFETDDDAQLDIDTDPEDVELEIDNSINEVDEDTDPGQREPDYDPSDTDWNDAADISDEDDSTSDTNLKDEPYDEWSETSTDEEIEQLDDIDVEDSISQLEETGYDEPLYYEDLDEDLDLNPINDIEEEIDLPVHRVDYSQLGLIIENFIDENLDQSVEWANLTPAVDFTDFIEPELGLTAQPGILLDDGYDPQDPFIDSVIDEMIDLGSMIDDVYVDLFSPDDSLGVPFFQFMDIFDALDVI